MNQSSHARLPTPAPAPDSDAEGAPASRRGPVPARPRGFGDLVGQSETISQLYPLCERLANLDVPVLLEGEAGTGKELLARSLHLASGRADRPFIVLDCKTVAPSLVESELFGREQVAFTGAVRTWKGAFQRAHGGTLFIEEISDLPLALQAKLRRAIESGLVQPVGADGEIKVEVRIIAATRRDVRQLVREGRLRTDLFHRLSTAHLELPPLGDRHGDVALLAEHFCAVLGADSVETARVQDELSAWASHPWPGNVRELRNVVTRQVDLRGVASRAPKRTEAPSFADELEAILSKELPFRSACEEVLTLFRRRYVEAALGRHGGMVGRAARASGLCRRYFQRLKAEGGSVS